MHPADHEHLSKLHDPVVHRSYVPIEYETKTNRQSIHQYADKPRTIEDEGCKN